MPSEAQREFMNGQVFAMTLAATAQRSNMYAAELTEVERKPVQRTLRFVLEEICAAYVTPVDDLQHVLNIGMVAQTLSNEHGALLKAGRMKFGHAQKALNLHLKYLWCSERIPMPPHCPLDSIILKKIPGFTQIRWTQLDSSKKYEEIISAAKCKASLQNLSLPEWELIEYNRRDA
jgi:hypothetical protein